MKDANQAEGIGELCWRSSIGGFCQGYSEKEEIMNAGPIMKKEKNYSLRSMPTFSSFKRSCLSANLSEFQRE